MASSESRSINNSVPGIALQKYRGTLSLLGPAINDFALSSLQQTRISNPNIPIPQPHEQQHAYPYHITVLTKDEIRSLSPENQRRVDALLRLSSNSNSDRQISNKDLHQYKDTDTDIDTNHLFPLGIGSYSSVYWTVIIWASGQKLRKTLSLPPKHFHITLSAGPDIHDPPNGKGVESLVEPLDFSFSSSSPSKTTIFFDNIPTTHLDHLAFTLHLFQSHVLAQLCATALILRDEGEGEGESQADDSRDRHRDRHRYKGYLRYADTCWALRKYKLAMLGYGCVWERVAWALSFLARKRKQNEKKKKHKEELMEDLEEDDNSNEEEEDEEEEEEEEEEANSNHQKIQRYALKKLIECARHTEWGHVFRSDEVEDVLSPHPLLHDVVRAGLMRVWGEELRGVISRSVRSKAGSSGGGQGGEQLEEMGTGCQWIDDSEKENNPRSALFIPIFSPIPTTSRRHPNENRNPKPNHYHNKSPKFKEFYRLPRFFSWVVPFHLALMSTPKSRADVRALASCALGIRRVVTLTEEERLPREWFGSGSRRGGGGDGQGGGGGGGERDIVNTFLPVKNMCPPSIEQMDCVVRLFLQDEEEENEEEWNESDEDEDEDEKPRYRNKKRGRRKRNTPMLIHCGGGKGRAGTVAACYLVSFGFAPPPPPPRHRTLTTNQQDENQNLMITQPKLSAQTAITALRALRPGSLETSIQERFVSEWASVIWKRRSVYPPEGEGEPLLPAGRGVGAGLEVEGSLGSVVGGGQSQSTDGDSAGAGAGPVLVMLVGLPGSGKSWFARALMARDPGGWVYVSQDEIGSREMCERAVARGPLSSSPSRTTPPNPNSNLNPNPHDSTTTTTARPSSRSTFGGRGLILDRCNPTSAERQTWIALARTWAEERVVCVHFDYAPELCLSRAQRRLEHPTLQPGGRVRTAVRAMEGVFEVPVVGGSGGGRSENGGEEKDKAKGKGKAKEKGRGEKGVMVVLRVRSFDGAREAAVLVDGLGRRQGGSGGVVMKFPRTPHLMDLGGAGGDDVWVQGGVDGFMRAGGGGAKVLSERVLSVDEKLENSDQAPNEDDEEENMQTRPTSISDLDSTQSQSQTRKPRRRTRTVITEKLDGANMGISLSSDGRTILVQNRSHYITSNTHAQFKKLDAWLARCGEGVRRVLLWPDGGDKDNGTNNLDSDDVDLFPDRYILYGEWMAARHSVGYDRLEDWFVAFDLYDRVGGTKRRGGFVDGETMRRRCGGGGIVCVPVIFEGSTEGEGEGGGVPSEEELVKMVNERSLCGEERREGVVVKIEEWDGEEVGWVRARGKIVRGDFIAGNEHWTKGQLVFNKLKKDY